MTPAGDQPAVDRGVEMLARRDHFAGELSQKLLEAGFAQVEIEAAVELLTRRGVLNDLALATRKIVRWRQAGRSTAECQGRLEALGVPEDVIDAGLDAARVSHPDGDGIDPDLQNAVGLLKRWIAAERPLDPGRDIARLTGRLGRRGFESDTIRAALRHCGLEDDPSFEEPHA